MAFHLLTGKCGKQKEKSCQKFLISNSSRKIFRKSMTFVIDALINSIEITKLMKTTSNTMF
jgi:hypothetical protein